MKLPPSTKKILLMLAFFAKKKKKKSAVLGQNSTFTQSDSMRDVLETF